VNARKAPVYQVERALQSPTLRRSRQREEIYMKQEVVHSRHAYASEECFVSGNGLMVCDEELWGQALPQ
jgi:hypothetical protein